MSARHRRQYRLGPKLAGVLVRAIYRAIPLISRLDPNIDTIEFNLAGPGSPFDRCPGGAVHKASRIAATLEMRAHGLGTPLSTNFPPLEIRMAAAENPSTIGVTCPLCDVQVRCRAHFNLTPQDNPDRLVFDIDVVFSPDVVEQFTPHLRQAHPVEFAQMSVA